MENTRACKRDNNTVYIAGNETGYLIIVKSTDRGITWQNPIEHSSLRDYQVRAIGCIPKSSGDIILLQGFKANQEWAIFRSEDGGLSFDKVLYIPSTQSWAPHMYFYISTWGEIFSSSFIDGELRIISSNDLGLTWNIKYQYNATNTAWYGNDNQWHTLRIIEGDNGVIIGNIYMNGTADSNSYFLFSPNRGVTWQGIPLGQYSAYTGKYNNGLNVVRLANGILVVLCCNTAYNNTLHIRYSNDNGNSWGIRSLSNYPLVSATATQNTIIFSTSDNKIYRLTDILNGSPTQVATTTYPIYDFVGFESS